MVFDRRNDDLILPRTLLSQHGKEAKVGQVTSATSVSGGSPARRTVFKPVPYSFARIWYYLFHFTLSHCHACSNPTNPFKARSMEG